MNTDLRLLAVVGLALLNGIYSHIFLFTFIFRTMWYPTWLPNDPSVFFYVTTLLSATLALMIAGVPAAIYERVMGEKTTGNVSYGIWIAGLLAILAAYNLQF